MARGRGLAPLVGAGLAAVAAGSLVLFSLLAQQTALAPSPGEIIVPRVPDGAGRGPVTLPAPDTSPTDAGDRSILPLVVSSPTFEASVTDPGIPPSDPSSTPASDESLLASLDLPIRVSEALDLEGPIVNVRPPGLRPGEDEDPPVKDPPGEDPPPEGPDRDCPGRPDKLRDRGEHPHGGPPACGNPHGAPPGQAKDRPAAAAGAANASGSRSDGGRHGSPPGQSKDDSASPKPKKDSSGTPPGHSAGGSRGPKDSPGNSGNPHEGPPGQSKKGSAGPPASPGGSGEDSGSGGGHPHGAPPGQTKKG